MKIRDAAQIDQTVKEPLEWGTLWTKSKENPLWVLTTMNMFIQMLEVVPPRALHGNSFLVGEANDVDRWGNMRYSCFVRDGLVYHKYLTVEQYCELVGVQLGHFGEEE